MPRTRRASAVGKRIKVTIDWLIGGGTIPRGTIGTVIAHPRFLSDDDLTVRFDGYPISVAVNRRFTQEVT